MGYKSYYEKIIIFIWIKTRTIIQAKSEYNKFIIFTTKYNEEIIAINKKHDIANGILSIGKKIITN